MEPLQQTVSCLTNKPLIVSPGGRGGRRRSSSGRVHSLSVADGPILLDGGLTLEVGMLYEIVETDDPQRGPYKVTTRGYAYAVHEGRNLAAAHHWHPTDDSSYHEPHIHIPAIFPGLHFPCGRTSLEEVVRFCIRELGVEPRRDDWEPILAMNEDRFQTYRTWPPQPQLPRTCE